MPPIPDDSLNIHDVFAYRVRFITVRNRPRLATAWIHVHVHGKGQLYVKNDYDYICKPNVRIERKRRSVYTKKIEKIGASHRI